MVLLIVSTNDCVTFCHTEAFLLNFIAVTAVDVTISGAASTPTQALILSFCHTKAFLLNFIAVTTVGVILFYYFILCFLLFDHGYSQYDAILY